MHPLCACVYVHNCTDREIRQINPYYENVQYTNGDHDIIFLSDFHNDFKITSGRLDSIYITFYGYTSGKKQQSCIFYKQRLLSKVTLISTNRPNDK